MATQAKTKAAPAKAKAPAKATAKKAPAKASAAKKSETVKVKKTTAVGKSEAAVPAKRGKLSLKRPPSEDTQAAPRAARKPRSVPVEVVGEAPQAAPAPDVQAGVERAVAAVEGASAALGQLTTATQAATESARTLSEVITEISEQHEAAEHQERRPRYHPAVVAAGHSIGIFSYPKGRKATKAEKISVAMNKIRRLRAETAEIKRGLR